jgi:hypothetical protein
VNFLSIKIEHLNQRNFIKLIMKNKIDLTDTTFLIPVRIDSISRLENLLMVVDYILNHFDTNIHVLEASGYNNSLLSSLLPNAVNFTWEEDYDVIFYRTHYINILTKNCSTENIAVWDTDVIVPVKQIIQSLDLIRCGKADFINPYHKFLDSSFILRELFFKTKDITVFFNNEPKMISMYTPNPIGGAFFAKRKSYLDSGLENENFYGWGIEDGERVRRWMILGYMYGRVQGSLYHLTHSRGQNSNFHSDEQYEIKTKELHRISGMSKKELEKEVKLWS